jgi:hypothetical protein
MSSATSMSWLAVALRRLTMWTFRLVSAALSSPCVPKSSVTDARYTGVVAGLAGAGGVLASRQTPE